MWATASDVLSITGKSVSSDQIRQAQYVVQTFTGLTDDSVLSPRNEYWMRLAVAYQAAYDEDVNRPQAGVTSLSQGDLSVGFDDSNKDLAPRAYAAIRRMVGNYRNIPVRSIFYETEIDYSLGEW